MGNCLFSQSSGITLSGDWMNRYAFGAVYGVGNYVYAGSGNIMYILDVSNPTSNASSVRALGEVQAASTINWINVTNTKAYLATGDSGLRIANVTNPYQPVNMGFCYTNGRALCVAVSGNFAYVAADTAGLRIINISNPNAPVTVSYFDLGNNRASAVSVSGNYAYVAYGASGMQIVDISNPASPVATSFLNWSNFNPVNVFIQGNYAYVIGYDSLHIINITNPLSPVQTSCVFFSYISGNSLFVTGNYAYTYDEMNNNYVIWNISNPSAPVSVGYYWTFNSTSISSQSIYVNGSIGFFPNRQSPGVNAVDIVNVSNPSSTSLIGRYMEPEYLMDASSSGNYVYVMGWTATTAGIISIFDIGNPAFPSQVGMYDDSANFSPSMPFELVGSGNHLFFTGTKTGSGNSYGFKIIDVSNPYNPVYTGKFNISNGVAKGISISGNYAYVCYQSLGLRVVDISNLNSPVQVGSVNLTGGFQAMEVFVLGNYAYVTDNAGKFHIVDVSNPALPVDVGSVQMSANGSDIFVSGNYAYVAKGAQGLQIIDISNPVSPSLLGSYSAVSGNTKLHKIGNMIYLSDYSNGLQAIDISNPSAPFQAGYYFGIPSGVRNVFADSMHIYLVASYGLYIFNDGFITETSNIQSQDIEFSIFPNPSNGKFTIKNNLIGNCDIEIFNSFGQEIFQKENVNENNFEIDLSEQANGIYFVRIVNDEKIYSQKIIKQ